MSETNPIIVYSSPGCGACGQVKDFLARKGVAFEVRDITEDESAQLELMDLGFSAVPVTVVGESAPVLGADLEKIGALLEA